MLHRPRPRGYEEVVKEALATERAVARAPQVAQEIVNLVQIYPSCSQEKRREVAGRLRELAAQLRSA